MKRYTYTLHQENIGRVCVLTSDMQMIAESVGASPEDCFANLVSSDHLLPPELFHETAANCEKGTRLSVRSNYLTHLNCVGGAVAMYPGATFQKLKEIAVI